MTKIPFSDALRLVRDLGLLVNQVAIYGISHKVIQQQAIDFFNLLKPLLLAHSTVEFALQGDKLGVNGELDGIDIMSARNLKEKMLLHKLPGIFFAPDLTQAEFLSFLSFLGKPPGKIQEMGGFEELLKRTGMKGVSLAHFVYERVGTQNQKQDPIPPKEEETPPPAPPAVKRPKRVHKPKPEGMEEGSPSAQSALDPANHAPIQARLRRKRVQTELGSLFAEVSQLVGDAHAPQNAKMVEALRSIRDTLRTSTEPAKERIASLLGQEEPLPPAPPGTRPKRKKPKAPKFSHAEYMSRFAELTQEIAQPLTVTNSVIEVLRQGQIGSLNETQTQFLDLALESVDRVNQLIKYMHTLFGEPESFTPDAAIIQETYV
jgi:hypothetical protein